MIDCKKYPVEIRPLSEEDGGGWLATFPDLPGGMGDNVTPEAAIEEGYSAAWSWLKVAEECGDPIPLTGTGGELGRFVARMPKSLHTRLVARAEQEGVSMNTLWCPLSPMASGHVVAPDPTQPRWSPPA